MAYRIKEIREEKKMSQEELAEKSNVSRTTISKLENGEEVETFVGTLKSLAKALEVPMSELF